MKKIGSIGLRILKTGVFLDRSGGVIDVQPINSQLKEGQIWMMNGLLPEILKKLSIRLRGSLRELKKKI